jgi:hypothetical protein
MDPFLLVGVMAALVIGVGAVAMYFREGARIRRALRAAPRRKIAEAAEGAVVRIDGQAIAHGETLIAPLTGRTCVFYEALIEEFVSQGKSGNWRVRVREVRGVPFVVDDGTGRAIVDPRIARVDVKIDATTRSGTFDAPTPIEEAFLHRHGMSGQGMIFNKRLRYREGAIEVGEPVAVMGNPVREPDTDAAARARGYREGPPERLRLGGSPDHPILISDARGV